MEQSSLESQSRGCAKTPILTVTAQSDPAVLLAMLPCHATSDMGVSGCQFSLWSAEQEKRVLPVPARIGKQYDYCNNMITREIQLVKTHVDSLVYKYQTLPF